MYKRIFLIMALLVQVSCATNSITPIDMANSEKKSEVFPPVYLVKRLLSPTEHYPVQILEVDGKEVDGGANRIRTPIYVSEGHHILKVRVLPANASMGLVGYYAAQHQANENLSEVQFDAVSGTNYVIKAEITESINFLGVKTPKKYKYSIEEYSDFTSPEIEFQI